jgi:hypothetical protein
MLNKILLYSRGLSLTCRQSAAQKWISRKPSKRVGTFRKWKFSLLNYKGTFTMSKAKLVLSAVALFAMVGGVLAFKATRGLLITFYSTRTFTTRTIPTGPIITHTICDATLFTTYTTIPNGSAALLRSYSTTAAPTTGPCPVITVFTAF